MNQGTSENSSFSDQFEAIFSPYSQWILCFTDGSKTDKRIGKAFMINMDIQCFNLLPDTRSLVSEQMAIYQSLLHLPVATRKKFIIIY